MIEQEIFHGNMLCIFSSLARDIFVCRKVFIRKQEQAMIINVTC